MITTGPFHFRRKPSRKKFSRSLKKILGFSPGNLNYYELAFIHRSASHAGPDGSVINNERLEYLGDAILDAVISDYLFHHFPSKDEGFLSKMRSRIVRRETLNELAVEMGIEKFLVSHTEANKSVKHLWGNTFEALIGAVYLDKGYRKTRKFIVKNIIGSYLDLPRLQKEDKDYKSQLIEWAQKNREEIVFEFITEERHGHETVFITSIRHNNRNIGSGKAASKKQAEQLAAQEALDHIRQ